MSDESKKSKVLPLTFEHRGRIELARLCHNHRLYVNGWALRNLLIDNMLDVARDKIVVAFYLGIPIGVVLIRKRHVNLYVKSKYRRRGVGKALIDYAVFKFSLDRKKLKASEGVTGSIAFYASIDIPCEIVNESLILTREQTALILAGIPWRQIV